MKFDGDLRNHLTVAEVNEKCAYLKVGDHVILPAKTIDIEEDCPAVVTRIYPYVIEFLLPCGYKRYLQKFDCMELKIIKSSDINTTSIDDRLMESLSSLGEM